MKEPYMSQPIQNPQIMIRRFEGRTDPEKNHDALTSKYYPSHRYAVVCTWYGKRHVETCRTKRDAQDWIDYHSVSHAL